jgi:hypothetical protein
MTNATMALAAMPQTSLSRRSSERSPRRRRVSPSRQYLAQMGAWWCPSTAARRSRPTLDVHDVRAIAAGGKEDSVTVARSGGSESAAPVRLIELRTYGPHPVPTSAAALP